MSISAWVVESHPFCSGSVFQSFSRSPPTSQNMPGHMPPPMSGQIWNLPSNVIVFPVDGLYVRVLDWHAPDSHVWFRVVFPSDGYDGPEWAVFVAFSSRFDDPSRTTWDGRYHSTSAWA